MESKTCRTCRWWGQRQTAYAPGRRECRVLSGGQPDPITLIFEWDQTPVEPNAEVYTPEDFGCIHWEQERQLFDVGRR